MKDKDALEIIIKKLKKHNIEQVEEKQYLYIKSGDEYKGVSFSSTCSNLTSKGEVTNEYSNFIIGLNRVWILFLELFSEPTEDFAGYQIKIQPKCEVCLILLVSAFETYLTEKFCSIAVKMKNHIIKEKVIDCTNISEIRITFQDKKKIKKYFKEIGISLLRFYDLDEQKPLSNSEEEKKAIKKEEEEWNKTTNELWRKIFEDDKINGKYGYYPVRHKIIHKYIVTKWKIIDKPYIKDCFLDIAEIVYKFEKKINKKHRDLLQFMEWQKTMVNLKDK